jgi:tellurite resistance protein TerC
VLHAMHENTLGFVNGGRHIEWAPEIPIEVSLAVIVTTLVLTTVVSLWRSSRYTPEELDEHTGPRHTPHHY